MRTTLSLPFPLATEDRNRCTYKRENGHRCARVAAHWPADAHHFREDAGHETKRRRRWL